MSRCASSIRPVARRLILFISNIEFSSAYASATCSSKTRVCAVDADFVEAAHAAVELGGEGDERKGEGGAAGFAEAEA